MRKTINIQINLKILIQKKNKIMQNMKLKKTKNNMKFIVKSYMMHTII